MEGRRPSPPPSRDAALGRLVEQQDPPIVCTREWFCRQLVVFKLEGGFNGTLESGLQRGHLFGFQGDQGFEQQAVAAVLHVRDHALRAGGHWIVRIVFMRQLVPGPVAPLDVQHESVLMLILAACPAQVNAP